MQNEQVTSTVLLNGEQAKKELELLEIKAVALKKAIKESTEIGDLEGVKRYQKELKGINSEMKVTKIETFNVKKVMDDLSGSTLKDLYAAQKKVYNQMKNGDVKRGTAEWKEYIEVQKKLKKEISSVNEEMNIGESKLSKMASRLGMFVGLSVGVGAIGSVLSSAAQTIMEFDTAVSELSAITGASGTDLDFLKNKAKELGEQYGKSATDIVTAMKLVGSAKPELLTNVEALSDVTKSVLTLSKATGMDLGDTTKSLTTIMNQFGLSALEADRTINVLAAGSKFGAVEVDYLGDAISKVGTVAKSAGLNIETTTAVMELFGEKGVKAETAGNGFKKVLVELQSDTKNYTNGVFDLNKAIDNNQKIGGDNIALQKKFGTEFFSLAQILIQNKDRFQELTTQVTGTTTAEEQMAIATDNLKGDMDKMTSAWDSFILSLEDGKGPIASVFRGIIQGAQDALLELKKLTQSDEQNSAENRSAKTSIYVKSVKKVAENKTDKVGFVNSIIIGEQEKYIENQKEINKLEAELVENDKKGFFMHSTQLESENKKRIAILKAEVNQRKEDVNALAGFRKSLRQEVIPVVTEETVTDTPDKTENLLAKEKKDRDKAKKDLIADNKATMKELTALAITNLEQALEMSRYENREILAGKKQTLAEEHSAKVKSLQEDEQLELDKLALSGKSETEIGEAKKLITQKYKTLIAEETASFDEKEKAKALINEQNYLQDSLVLATNSLQDRFDIEKKIREAAMLDELKLVEKGSKEEKAIRDKYRKYENEADGNLQYEKHKVILDYAEKGLDIANDLNSLASALGNRELKEFEKNNKDKANFEEEFAKKKAEIAKEEAVRAKAIGALSVIISTSAAVIGALAPPPIGAGPIAGIPLAIAAGASGAIQLAAILAAPLPELWTGGFTTPGDKYKPAGIVHAGEFVGNQDATNHAPIRRIFNLVDYAQKTNSVARITNDDIVRSLNMRNGYSGGGFVGGGSTVTNNNGFSKADLIAAVQMAMGESTAVNAALLAQIQKGIVARYKISGNDGVVQGIDDYNKLINNGKRG